MGMAIDRRLLMGIYDLLQIVTWQLGNQGAKSPSPKPDLISPQPKRAPVLGDGSTMTIEELRRRLPGIERPPEDAFTRGDTGEGGPDPWRQN